MGLTPYRQQLPCGKATPLLGRVLLKGQGPHHVEWTDQPMRQSSVVHHQTPEEREVVSLEKTVYESKAVDSSVVTWWSSCLRRLDRDSTQVSRDESCGSILLQRRDTTAIAECRVSLWTRWPLSRMKVSTQFRPPASNTAPDSRVQINSSTWPRGTQTAETTLQRIKTISIFTNLITVLW